MPNRLNISRLSILLLGCFTIIGCGSGGNDSSNSGSNNTSGDVSSLQIVAPKTIFSKPAESSLSYIVIKNPTAAAVSNLHYNLVNLIGGAKGAEIESASAANCAVVESMSQCNLKVTIPAGAVAGSLGFSANNENSNLSDKLNKSLKTGSSESQTIGVEQIAYNSKSGADGITLSYYHTVINGTPYILVTGLVASANAGSFNNIVLVDDNGNVLPNQEIIGNLNNAQGSTFSMLVQLPSANGTSLTVKIQTQQNGKAVSTSTQGYTLSLTEGVGIANTLPEAVYLTSTNPEQIVTFSNTGDSVAQLKQLLASNPNIEVIFTPVSLESGAITTATLRLKNTTISTVNGTMTLSYNNGQNETANTTIVDQNVLPAPTPSPAPTPTPGPGPSPAPLITITDLTGTSSSMMGTPITFAATITGTGSSTLTAALANSVTGTIVSDPSSCALTVGGTSSCTFSIIPWYTGFDNSIVGITNPVNFDPFTPTGTEIILSATNSVTIAGVTSNTISYTITTPYVYLAQTGQTSTAPFNVTAIAGADGNVHAGIPWAVAPSGGSTAPNPRFEEVDNGACIKDNLTGLIWVKNLSSVNSGNSLTWSNALTTAAAGTWCAQSAGTWRVPNINELASLINYAEANPVDNWLTVAIGDGGAGFSNVQSNYWSSSSSAAITTSAWYVTISDGGINPLGKNSSNFSRLFPVRGGQ